MVVNSTVTRNIKNVESALFECGNSNETGDGNSQKGDGKTVLGDGKTVLGDGRIASGDSNL